MKEVWIVYEEAFTNTLPGSFVRNTRIFDSFEKAKRVMAEQIRNYAVNGNGEWSIPEMIDAVLDDEDFQEYSSEECLALTSEYLKRFFQGEAGGLDICIDDMRYNAFTCSSDEPPAWNYDGFGFYTDRLPSSNAEFFIMDINAFLMDDPDKKYYCLVKDSSEEWDNPYYLYIVLSKTEIE